MATSQVVVEYSTTCQIAARRQRVMLLGGLTTLASVVYTEFVLRFPVGAAVSLLAWILLAAIAWRPRIGLYVVFGLIPLLEPDSADPLMQPASYFYWGLQRAFGLTGFILSPLEMLLLVTFFVWLGQGIAKRRLDFRGGQLGRPMLLFFVTFLVGLASGLLRGGDPYIASWEARALLYFFICYLLASNTIRTHRHAGALMTLALIGASLFAVEASYRRIALLETDVLPVIPEFAYGHDSPIILGICLLLIVAQLVSGAPRWQRVVGPLLVPVIVYAMLATERRAAYIAPLVAFLAFTVIFLVTNRKAFLMLSVPILVGGVIYLPIFWNDTSLVGQPARAIRSLREPDPRDAQSNLYRLLEAVNVRETIRKHPLLGVGFGREFYFVTPMPDMSWWPMWRYEPHNSIMWLWLKTGVIGFILFWNLMAIAITRAAFLAKILTEPVTRSFAFVSLAAIISSLVFSYVDLGLASARVCIILGTILGTLAVLSQLNDENERPRQTRELRAS